MSDLTLSWPGSHQEERANPNEAANNPPVGVVVTPGEGDILEAFGDRIQVHLGAAQTHGKLTVFTNVTPPGGGPPPHYHLNEDEWFIPQDGEVEFLLDGRWQAVAPGSIVFVPRGTVHTFRNTGDTNLKTLTHTSPAGFERFFALSAVEFAKDGPPDMERIIAIAAEHGIHFVRD